MTLLRPLRALAALASISVLGASLTMCSGGGDNTKKAVVEGVAKITVSASPDKVPADGTATDVTVLAVQEDGTNGAGQVSLQVTNGTLNGAAGATTLDLASGRGTAKWTCDAAQKSACKGTQTVTATWNGKTATATVEFTGSATGDAGPGDAGPDDGGPADGGPTTDGGADAQTAALTLAASKAKIYIGTNDYATLTATVKRPDGGLVANESVSFTTDNGLLSDTLDGGLDASFAATTAANGTAQVILRDNNVAGNATVVVTRNATSQTAQTVVAIAAAQTLTYDATKCKNVACTIMGVQHSGFNEQAQVSFKVVDAQNNPVPGMLVTFAIPSPPQGTQVTASATTDAQGIAVATVTSGPAIGSFIVNASVSTPSGVLTTPSPTIGIRGAIPVNKGFNFSCRRVNLNAFDAPVPPNLLTTQCDLTLVDRYGNRVGTGTSVNFKTEAGTLPNSVATQAYVAGGANTSEGQATVQFSTAGNLPEDVAPFAAVVGQYPNDRKLEPSWADGLITRNPRDGLVTLLAYVQGEEYFDDKNANGKWDSGEQFHDQGEPFVDADDSGAWNAGEVYLDVNGNNAWDGPNGVWDATATVWAETRVLYTDKATAGNSFASPSTFTTVAPGGSISLLGYFLDFNKNYISALAPTTLALSFSSTRAVTSSVTAGFVDDYGFPITSLDLAAGGAGPCAGATPICVRRTVFTKWPGDAAESAVGVTFNNPVAATPPGGSTTCTMKATSGVFSLSLSSTGTFGP